METKIIRTMSYDINAEKKDFMQMNLKMKWEARKEKKRIRHHQKW